ncbi:MAG: hypothetical protein ACOVSW_18135, partial [Candidatus Kapaibacteriota bacterium]
DPRHPAASSPVGWLFFVRRGNTTRPTLKKAPDGESAPRLTFSEMTRRDPRHPAASSPSGGFFFASRVRT